jgi:hypothetical protein
MSRWSQLLRLLIAIGGLCLMWQLFSLLVVDSSEALLDSANDLWWQLRLASYDLWSSFPYLRCQDPGAATQPFAFTGAVFFCSRQPLHLNDFSTWSSAYRESNEAFVVRPLAADSNSTIQLQLHVPMSLDEVQQLHTFARPSHVGKGHVDEVDMAAVQMSTFSDEWKSMEYGVLKQLLRSLQQGLNVSGDDAAGMGDDLHELRLHSLLLYEPGDLFAPHTDSYRVPGMFATVVLSLPIETTAESGRGFEGGTLKIRRQPLPSEGGVGERVVDWLPQPTPGEPLRSRCDWGSGHTHMRFDDATNLVLRQPVLHYVAFFSDCAHELQTVTAGHRVVLVYHLVRDLQLLKEVEDEMSMYMWPEHVARTQNHVGLRG